MNEEMLFYPPYPYQNIEEEYLNEYRGNGNLFTPNQTLEYGNIFKKENKEKETSIQKNKNDDCHNY